jgi:hypothetical protein
MQSIKDKIEMLSKHHQIEIGRMLIHEHHVAYDENKNGIFINMSSLSNDIIQKLEDFINHVNMQETYLQIDEHEKDELKDTFFS